MNRNALLQHLKENLSHQKFLQLNESLDITKRMCTFLLRDPKRLTIEQAAIIAELVNLDLIGLWDIINQY